MIRTLFLIVITLISLTSFSQEQIKLSKYVKGEWKSYSDCIIATEIPPTIPEAIIAYSIDNYHFNINIIKFLWIKRYILKSAGDKFIYTLSKEKFTIVDIPNMGNDGEIIGKITVSDIKMPTGECDCLINPSIRTEYFVVTYNQKNIMIWIPTPTDTVNINYTDIYLRTIYWTRPNYSYSPITLPKLPPDIIPVIALKNETTKIK